MFFISPPFGNYLNFENFISIKGSYTLEPRPGLIQQIFKTLRYDFNKGAWINKIGLRNRGIDWALENHKNKNDIISIAILNENEVEQLLNKIPKDTNLELNVSCPNAEKKMVQENLDKFLNTERDWCIVKMSPLVSEEEIDYFYNKGFRQFHCSNTIPTERGGQSGKEIIEYNKNTIPYIKSKYPDCTVIGGGGIDNIESLDKYKKMGADHFSMSTIFFNPFKTLLFLLNTKKF